MMGVFDSVEINAATAKHRMFARFARSPAIAQRSLLRVLSIAHHQRIAPAVLVSNLAKEYLGGHRRRLERVAAQLSQGAPVTTVLEQSPNLLSDQQLLALQFGTHTGTLSEAYGAMLSETDFPLKEKGIRFPYFVLIAIVLIGICCFLMIFIVPVLYKISEEFGMRMNASMDLLVVACQLFAEYWWLGALMLIAVISFRSSRLGGRLTKRLMGFASKSNDAKSRELLQLLSISTLAGRPIPAALSTLARYHYDRETRDKLLRARNDIEQGDEVWDSLKQSKLLSATQADGLSRITDPQSMAWAMRRLSSQRQAQNGMMRFAINEIAEALLLVFAATLVGWIAFSFIQFLTDLTWALGAVH